MSDKNKTENPMADELLREVDEELKEEHFKKLVKKYAPVISCLIVLALVCVGGYEYWNYRKNKQILADDADLTIALDLAKNGKVDESLSALQKMRENASEGYAVLAALHQTTLLLEQGNTAEALNVLDSLVNDSKIPSPVRDLARFNKVSLAVDLPDTDLNSLEKELDPLTQEGQAWAAQAYELKALIALKQKDLSKARDHLYSLMALSDLTDDVRMRASENLALIEKEIEETAQTAPADDEKAGVEEEKTAESKKEKSK